MADKLMRDPAGRIWEERNGRWYEVSGARGGGMLAAEGMGAGEGLLVGAGRELTRMGRGVRSLLGGNVDELEAEANAQMSGARAAGPRGALAVGEALPSLATAPIGFGIGGAALRGGRALAEQTALGSVVGGIGHSGDQGMDAMTGALLGASGFGMGQLAGRVVGAIQQRGTAARMAVMDAADAARGSGAGGALPPGAPGAPGAAPGGPVRLGEATAPATGTEALAAGGALPGAAAGAPGLSRELARLAKRADELGLELTPGQKVGSVAQQQMEESLKSSPWSAGLFERQTKANVKRVGELAVRAIGEEGSELSQRVLNNAHERLAGVFESVAEKVGTVKADAPVLSEASARLRGIVAEASAGAATTPEVGRAAGRLAEIWEAGGQVTGQRLMHERTRLLKLSRQYTRNGEQLNAEGIHDVIGVIDDVIAAGVPKGQRAQLANARAQWRVLATLESGAAIDAKGGLNTGALFPALRREFPLEMVRGNAGSAFGSTTAGGRAMDLMDAVRVTQAFKSVVGNSGTATRMSMQGLVNNPVFTLLEGLGMNLAGRAYMGGGGLMASTVAAAPNVAPAAAPGLGSAGRAIGGLMGGY